MISDMHDQYLTKICKVEERWSYHGLNSALLKYFAVIGSKGGFPCLLQCLPHFKKAGNVFLVSLKIQRNNKTQELLSVEFFKVVKLTVVQIIKKPFKV